MDTGASRPCKRLVICCDGTWNRPDSDHVTNIEKIARTVATDLGRTGGVQQLVLYLAGVGAGSYLVDRLLGGAFGFGLFANIRSAYRFLALNYEPGDEIFVFGFSRGAYTARSLVGMIGRVGLLTRDALVADKLPEAVARYQRRSRADGSFGESDAEFRRDHCHPETPVHAARRLRHRRRARRAGRDPHAGTSSTTCSSARSVLCARQASRSTSAGSSSSRACGRPTRTPAATTRRPGGSARSGSRARTGPSRR